MGIYNYLKFAGVRLLLLAEFNLQMQQNSD